MFSFSPPNSKCLIPAELLCAPRLSVVEEEPTVPLSTSFTLACHLQGPAPARKTDWIRSGRIIINNNNNNNRINIVRDGTWNNLTITNITRLVRGRGKIRWMIYF